MNVCMKGDNIFILPPKGSKILPGVNLTSGQIIIMQLLFLCSLKGCFYFA